LKKRSKKLFPGASHAEWSTPQAFHRWDACGARAFFSMVTLRAKHVVAKPRYARGKVFWFFFSKKNFFPCLSLKA